jgi:2-amino-4-hydroxy-6-hydroxymethyldihydropteridine diphosphokinase
MFITKIKDIWRPEGSEIMNKAYLLTGGNTGNRHGYLQQAVELIGQSCGKVVKKSSLYETAPWGNTDQPAFFNQALLLFTTMTSTLLMEELLAIEEKMGRRRLEKYGPRIIDIDILLFNDEVIHSSFLIIPHPELNNRRFALTSLAEIAPRLQHPVLHKTVRQLLKECPDDLAVKKID